MNLYHTWIYEYFINAKWFIWGIVVLVLAGNILAPVIMWFLMSSRGLPFVGKKKGKVNEGKGTV